MSIEPLAIGAVIVDAVSLVAPLAAPHALTLHADGPTSANRPAHDGDGLQRGRITGGLRQILINLISNGVKYNHPAGTVEVTVRTTLVAGQQRGFRSR
jgi:signal transduction histidine kinase